MVVRVVFECGGCHAKANGTTWLQRRSVPLFGGDWRRDGGCFVRHEYDVPQDVAPEGWIAFDPYTGCCYCPTCWAEITKETDSPAPAKVGAS